MNTIDTFVVETQYGRSRVVVRVNGDVDLLTAPALAGVLGGLVDQGEVNLVIDLAEVGFLDAAGIRVIVAVSTRLGSVGGSLLLRSPHAQVRRVLEIVALEELIEKSPIGLADQALAGEQRTGDNSAGVTVVHAGSLASDLAKVAAVPAGAAVVDAALRLVTALVRATLEGADGASVSLTRHGKLGTVAATDETILQMDRDQYATGEGPCVSAATEGHWFHVESLDGEARWPQFVPRAIEGGIHSILSTPLLSSTRPVGALNIYSLKDHAFGQRDQELAAIFASEASTILAESHVEAVADQVTARLQGALRVREVIAQAQGIIMARRGVSAEVAATEIRQSSKALGLTIHQRSDEILASTDRAELIGVVSP